MIKENIKALKHNEMLEAIYLMLNESDEESYPPRSYLETEEMVKRLDAFTKTYGKGRENAIYCDLIDIVFMYNREAFRMGIKTALAFLFEKDLTGAGAEKC